MIKALTTDILYVTISLKIYPTFPDVSLEPEAVLNKLTLELYCLRTTMFKALTNPISLQIVNSLRDGGCVCEIDGFR